MNRVEKAVTSIVLSACASFTVATGIAVYRCNPPVVRTVERYDNIVTLHVSPAGWYHAEAHDPETGKKAVITMHKVRTTVIADVPAHKSAWVCHERRATPEARARTARDEAAQPNGARIVSGTNEEHRFYIHVRDVSEIQEIQYSKVAP